MFKLRERKLSEFYNHPEVKLKPFPTSKRDSHQKEKITPKPRRNEPSLWIKHLGKQPFADSIIKKEFT